MTAPLTFPDTTAALLFDCDGTLADSMPLHILAWQETFREFGIEVPAEFIDARAGMPTAAIIREANIEYRLSLDPAEFSQKKEARFESRLHEVRPIEAVRDTALAYYGKLPMAVVSGGLGPIVRATLEHLEISHLFEVIVAADDPVPAKPSPEIFREAARRLNVAPEKCHVFEDGDSGIVAAKAAGMTWTDVRQL